MKKLLAIMLALVLVMSLAACGAAPAADGEPAAEKESYVIGICQLITHPALDKATEGFIAAVTDGLGAENVTFDTQEAGGEASTCSTIVNGFVSSNVDLIMANATHALVAAYNATEDIPILGTSVTEYGVALGIENFNGLVGSNVSGTSDLADLSKQADMITEWCPDAQKVGLLFCSAEANSKYQVDEVQRMLEEKGLECKRFPFADTSDLMAVTQEAADYSDAIYIPTDNTAANNATAINSVCLPAGVPIIAGEAGICGACGIATMSIDYYDLGYKTGEMAVQILKGEANIEEMPIAYCEEVTYLYNEEICNELGITPLEGYDKLETE